MYLSLFSWFLSTSAFMILQLPFPFCSIMGNRDYKVSRSYAFVSRVKMSPKWVQGAKIIIRHVKAVMG